MGVGALAGSTVMLLTFPWSVQQHAIAKAVHTLCCEIVLPGRKSGFRAGFWPDSYRESLKIGLPAGLRPAGELVLRAFPIRIQPQSGPKLGFRPGSIIV